MPNASQAVGRVRLLSSFQRACVVVSSLVVLTAASKMPVSAESWIPLQTVVAFDFDLSRSQGVASAARFASYLSRDRLFRSLTISSLNEFDVIRTAT